MKALKKIFLISTITIFYTSGLLAFDFRSIFGGIPGADSGVGLIVSDIEFRKKQEQELREEQALFKNRLNAAFMPMKSTLDFLDGEIAKGVSAKRVSVLKERKQNLGFLRDLWIEIDNQFSQHITLIQNIVKYLNERTAEKHEPVSYSWKAFDEIRNNIDQIKSQINSENSKKDRLKVAKSSEKEEITFLKKEIETKTAEREKLNANYKASAKRGDGLAQDLSNKISVLDQEMDYAREKIELANLKIEKIDREERLKEDEIFLLRQKAADLNTLQARAQKKLRIDHSDVDAAKMELAKEQRIALVKKEEVARTRSLLKRDIGRLDTFLHSLDAEYAKIKESGKEKSVKGYLIDSRLEIVKNEKITSERTIDFLLTEKDTIDTTLRIKELDARIIEMLHNIGITTDKFEDLLAEFRREKRVAEHARKSYDDRRDEILSLNTVINTTKENLEKKRKELIDQKEKIFTQNQGEFLEAENNLRSSLNTIVRQKFTVDQHSSKITELLSRQDEMINQYSFIIYYLESQWTVGIWKRSHKAISLEQVWRAALESEMFFKKLFWDTPNYLGPSSIFNSIKALQFADYIGILLFVLLYILFFIIARLLLWLINRNSKIWYRIFSEHFAYTVSTGISSLIPFILKHFTVLFTWLFFFVHVSLELSYFKPLTAKYIIALFYLISIPLLMRASRIFINKVRALNEYFGYLFISEAMQYKITLLFEIFLYITALIIPIRKAFIVYLDKDVAFSVVSLAAYTLILVIIILFFFNKEDILKLLSGPNSFIVWLRKKVEKFYYPAFIFFMMLLILSNSYIGYSNLAWYLAFAVPSSLFLLYCLFWVQDILRKYSLFFFMKEEDDEVVNKFEHAKAYYGFFVVLSFILSAIVAFVLLGHIWGAEGYTLKSLWASISDEWVLSLPGGGKLGLVEIIKFGVFIAGGLVISSIINRLILVKIFEIFRTEPGVQNTVSKLTHYIIIILAIIFGFTAINLSQYALGAGALLIGIGFALRDQIADYFAGVLVLLERPIEIGHYIETDKFQGRVHRISARSTTIKTSQNFLVVVPNRDIISKAVVNWGEGRYAVGAELKVSVSYDADPEKVQKILCDTVKKHPLVLRVPAPVVRLEGFESFSFYFYCRCYISSRRLSDMWMMQSDLRMEIVKAFKENNIVIPIPQTAIQFIKNEAGNPVEIKFDKQ